MATPPGSSQQGKGPSEQSLAEKVEAYDIPEHEFAVYGTVFTDPAHADDVEAIYQQTTRRAMSDEEPGTVYYCICRDRTDPSIFHFFERYKSRKAFEEHNSQEIIQKLVSSGWMKDVKAVFAAPMLLSDP